MVADIPVSHNDPHLQVFALECNIACENGTPLASFNVVVRHTVKLDNVAA